MGEIPSSQSETTSEAAVESIRDSIRNSLKDAEAGVWDLLEQERKECPEKINYSKSREYLCLAEEIERLRYKVDSVLDSLGASKSNYKNQDASQSVGLVDKHQNNRTHDIVVKRTHDDRQSAVYFVFGDKLYKIAPKGENPNSLYKKTVPLGDVAIVLGTLQSVIDRKDEASVSEISKMLGPDFPSYKIQIPVMALVDLGILKQHGRGNYIVNDSKPTSEHEWMDALMGAKVRRDLLKKV